MIDNIYNIIGLKEPKIIEIDEIKTLFKKMNILEYDIGSVMPCFWEYQLPLVLPSSYWVRFHLAKENYKLNIHRKANQHGCFVYSEVMPQYVGKDIDETIYSKVIKKYSSCNFVSEGQRLLDCIFEHFDEELEKIQDRLDKEDPTCQIGIENYIFLSDFYWVQLESALLNDFSKNYNAAINLELLKCLNWLISEKVLLVTFEKIVFKIAL